MDKLLTIAIPTYNRPDRLLNAIKLLIPQLNDTVHLIVLDNNSSIDIESFLQDELSIYEFEKVRIFINTTNLGGDANFMRCFEYANSQYVWLLSDDDEVYEDSIKIVINEIEKYINEELIAINFCSNHLTRRSNTQVSNISDFVSKLDNFANILLISATVYRRDAYLENIAYGYWGSYSMASQILPALVAINKGKTYVFSNKRIINNLIRPRKEKWSDSQQTLALSSILEAPIGLTMNSYKIFGHKLFKHVVSYPRVLFDIIKAIDYKIEKIDDYHIYLYKKIFKTSQTFRQGKFKNLLLYYCCLILLKNHYLLKLFLKNRKIKDLIDDSSNFKTFQRK